MGIFEFLKRRIGTKETKEDLNKNQIELYDSSLFNGFLAKYNSDSSLFDIKKLTAFEKIKGLGLTKDISDLIDYAVINNPILSACYEKTFCVSDTPFEIFVKTKRKEEGERVVENIKILFPKLFGVYSLRDISREMLGNIIRYGSFNMQIIPNETGDSFEKFIFPQAYTIDYLRENNEWILIQDILGQRIRVNIEWFLRGVLFRVQNNDGIWTIPIFKAALHPMLVYDLFMESLKQISARTGMQKIFDFEVNIKEFLGNQDAPEIGTPEHVLLEKKIEKELYSTLASVASTLPNGKIVRPSYIKVNELSTVEPSSNLSTFHDLLVNQVITGAKSYLSIVGIGTKENQTTLSTNQKLTYKNLITTIQSKVDDLLIELTKRFCLLQGVDFLDVYIEREPPALDSALEEEQARKIRLENDSMEQGMGNTKKEMTKEEKMVKEDMIKKEDTEEKMVKEDMIKKEDTEEKNKRGNR